MNALSGLAHEAVSGGETAGDFLIDDFKFKNCSNGIAVARGSGELKSDPLLAMGLAELVFDEAEARAFAVGLPEIKVAVVIPVRGDDRPSVVDKVESAYCGDVGEALEVAI